MARGMRGLSVTVDFEQIQQAFRRLGATIQNVIEEAALAGADVIRSDAATRVMISSTIKTGALFRNIIVETKERQPNSVMVGIGPRRSIFYAHWVEFGTKPHYQPKRHYYHPGAQAFPFLFPAYETKKNEARVAIRAVLRRELIR